VGLTLGLTELVDRERAIAEGMRAAGIGYRVARTLAAAWYRVEVAPILGTPIPDDARSVANVELVNRVIAGDASAVAEIIATEAAARVARKAARA
jgi:hypothetical protein